MFFVKNSGTERFCSRKCCEHRYLFVPALSGTRLNKAGQEGLEWA
jgi:hypothetical protein